MSRFDRNKVSYDLNNSSYNKQIKVVNKNFKSNGSAEPVNSQDRGVVVKFNQLLEDVKSSVLLKT